MSPDKLRELLGAVARGEITPEAAAERLADLPFADLGFARLDLHRELRGGLHEAHGRVLVTRLAPSAAEALIEAVPGARYHERAQVLTAGESGGGAIGGAEQAGERPSAESPSEPRLPIAVVAAGTADLPAAEEAAVCAEWFGLAVERHFDVGLAGLHRLLAVVPALRRARAVIVAAGMDGALPAAVAGLVAAPVIAVPTSTGYGAAFGGLAPLLTMLNACAPGVAVVNIDNGFGAAVVAWRVAHPPALPPLPAFDGGEMRVDVADREEVERATKAR